MQILVRELDDGRGVWVEQRMFNSILKVGEIGSPFYDDHW